MQSATQGHFTHRATFQKWTEEEWLKLCKLREAGYATVDIAAALHRTQRQIVSKIYWEKMSPEKRDGIRSRINARRNASGEYKSVIHTDRSSFSRATPEMLADRDRRLLAHRSLGAIAFGDPPPGWSALDRRVG